ncbi:hypothetical protein nbrc107696_30660 [Gordonia spumicola]|uniref:DUF3710 domain-containing protein n=1 Tax=Gordonia spumicola TaxID=589161 RepID=A0A7I9VC82_9ACTN|nr:DUF3710 domain-containing protein [Gordonia spumicola]GEE02620.1 hypothetical protein nbrc107696_30660 [Gordonia spumicola]
MSGTKTIGEAGGPYDIDDLAGSPDDLTNSHLDLGSVLMPVVEGGQVTVEMSAENQPEAVYLVTPVGRIGIHAFAAPRSGGLWREVVRELAESLRAEGAQTSIEDGHWGREVLARVEGGHHRFIGVDGSRWMVRLVASGPDEAGEQLAQLARAVLAETVVRRGTQPYPPREVLPLVLPPVLAEQVAAAQQQMAQEQGLGPTSEPISGAPAPEASADAGADEVLPGGAVAQSAAATVFTEAQPSGSSVDEESDDAQAVEPSPDALSSDAPSPSRGSALSRLRGRRRR